MKRALARTCRDHPSAVTLVNLWVFRHWDGLKEAHHQARVICLPFLAPSQTCACPPQQTFVHRVVSQAWRACTLWPIPRVWQRRRLTDSCAAGSCRLFSNCVSLAVACQCCQRVDVYGYLMLLPAYWYAGAAVQRLGRSAVTVSLQPTALPISVGSVSYRRTSRECSSVG